MAASTKLADRSVYIVFFATDFKTGRFIRTFTRYRYNHVALSLDGMKTLCSFSRVYLDHPMIAGFVTESPRRYLMSGKTAVRAYKLITDEETFSIIEGRIAKLLSSPDDYVYNYLSCAAYAMGKRFTRKHAFTCVEFVRDTLVKGGVLLSREGKKVSIRGLERELSAFDCEMTEGNARELLSCSAWGNDRYLDDCGGRIAVMREASRRMVRMIRK